MILQNPHKQVCAWCNKTLREGVEPISHGICDRCKDAMFWEVPESPAKKDYWHAWREPKTVACTFIKQDGFSVGFMPTTPEGRYSIWLNDERKRKAVDAMFTGAGIVIGLLMLGLLMICIS